MKRIAIFAHYDQDNLIDEYVVEYLLRLKEVAQHIIFISDCDIKPEQIKKIEGLILDYVCKKHGEYDFGSYKIGLELIKTKYPEKLSEVDELIIANDSCFTISSFVPVFAEMSARKNHSDFWGMLICNYGSPHVQSYFIVFKSNVLEHLMDFMKLVKKESSKEDVIEKYEIGLTKYLAEKGFSYDSFTKDRFALTPISNARFVTEIFNKNPGFPLIKIGFLTSSNKINFTQTHIYANIVRRIGYERIFNILHSIKFRIWPFRILVKQNILRVKLFGITVKKISL